MNNKLINKKIYGFILLLGMSIVACKKTEIGPGSSSLIILNANTGSNQIVTNFDGTKPISYLAASRIFYNTYAAFNSYTGTQPLGLYEYPDTTVNDQPLYNLSLQLPTGAIQTLILTGTRSKQDSILTNDYLPYYESTDSVMGIRLIHAASGARPVKVIMKGKSDSQLVPLLSYKGVTNFIKLPVVAGAGTYVFEFRDATDNTLIASYTAAGIGDFGPINNPWFRRNFSLVLTGAIGQTGATAPTIVQIAHSR